MKAYDDGSIISVVIPNWNGKNLLETCLPSLEKQNFSDFEVIVVDNGSEDDSIKYIEENHPIVHVIAFPENRGFAPAVNGGIFASHAKYVALLNNDTEAHPDWLAEGVRAMEKNSDVGFCACKMLDYWQRDIINGAGDNYIKSGNAYKRGFGKKDSAQYNCEKRVFGACAGAAIYRRKIFDEIGGFDDDFFAYCEDVDWSFRAQLAGHQCLFVPSSIVYHMEGISSAKEGMDPLAKYRNTLELESPRKTYWIARNKMYVIIKNLPFLLMLKYFFSILKDGIITSGLAHLIHTGYWRNFLSGLFTAFWNLPKFLSKRRKIQQIRRLSIKQVDALIEECELERRRGFLSMCLPSNKSHENPFITVIVHNYDNQNNLDSSLESIFSQDYPAFQVVLASPMTKKYNHQQVIYTHSLDEALEKAKGSFIAILDSAVTIPSNWLSEMTKTAINDSQTGMVGCKIVSKSNGKKINTIGWQIYSNGTVIPMAKNEDDFNQHSTLRQIFAPCMQAALFSMEMLNEIGNIDDHLDFSNLAIDIGWRGRLMGWKALLSPNAIAISNRESEAPSKFNQFYIMVKNWTFQLVLRHFWRLAFAGLWQFLFRKKGITQLPELLSKRRKVLHSRMIPRVEIEEWFKLL